MVRCDKMYKVWGSVVGVCGQLGGGGRCGGVWQVWRGGWQVARCGKCGKCGGLWECVAVVEGMGKCGEV